MNNSIIETLIIDSWLKKYEKYCQLMDDPRQRNTELPSIILNQYDAYLMALDDYDEIEKLENHFGVPSEISVLRMLFLAKADIKAEDIKLANIRI